MTEPEWLACTDPTPMLEFLKGTASNRKLRLFAVACCRRIWDLLVDERSRKAVEVAELAVEGQATIAQRTDSVNEAGNACSTAEDRLSNKSVFGEFWASNAAYGTVVLDAVSVGHTPETITVAASVASDAAQAMNNDDERNAQATLLRDIFGNPFRAVTVNPTWLIPTVTTLARMIYEDRSFDQMPDLADALEAAGCTDEEILAHCRGSGEHVRGCRVVDLLLGRE